MIENTSQREMNRIRNKYSKALNGIYNIIIIVNMTLCSCTELERDKSCQISQVTTSVDSSYIISNGLLYSIGFENAVRDERDRIRELVLNWHFTGEIIGKHGNILVIRIESTNTPRVLPKEYIPNFDITDIEKINSEHIVAKLKISCKDKTSLSKIRIGCKAEKGSGTSIVRVGLEKIELIP